MQIEYNKLYNAMEYGGWVNLENGEVYLSKFALRFFPHNNVLRLRDEQIDPKKFLKIPVINEARVFADYIMLNRIDEEIMKRANIEFSPYWELDPLFYFSNDPDSLVEQYPRGEYAYNVKINILMGILARERNDLLEDMEDYLNKRCRLAIKKWGKENGIDVLIE